MSIVKYKPDTTDRPLSTPDTIVETKESNFTALVPESRVKELIKYVEGHPWSVNYYGILKRTGNTLESYDPKAINNTQSYYKVNNLVLQVSDPLSSSYDENTGITTIIGSAIIPLGMKPNVGDLFLANVDTGEDAWFNIMAVERRTFTKKTVYEISYRLQTYASQDPSYGDILERRVNSEYHFNKDTNYFNRDMLVRTEVHEAREQLKRWLYLSQEYYFDTFCRDKGGTLLIPGTASGHYDPLLLNFIRKTVPGEVLIDRKLYYYEHFDRYLRQKSLLDVLLTRNRALLNSINRSYGFASTSAVDNRARFGTLGHSEISYVLYPNEPSQDQYVDTKYPAPTNNSNPITDNNYFIDSSLITHSGNNDNEYVIPVLHALFDKTYIVSDRFYEYLSDSNVIQDLSYIELIIYRFINEEALSKVDLWTAVKDYDRWSLLHQYYLMPAMWHIIRSNI